jgi:hypothetical protein
MIYAHHAAKVCWAIDKVAWRRGFKKIQRRANRDDNSPSPEDSEMDLKVQDEEEEQLLADERLRDEKERKIGFFSAIKASREHQQKNNMGLLKVSLLH